MVLTDIRVEEQDLSVQDLVLEARDGESLEIVARGVSGAAAGTTVEEFVREELMLAYQSDEGDESVMLEDAVQQRHTDFLSDVRDMGLRAPAISVPEGQSWTLSTDSNTGQATVLYREATAGLAGDTQPGGPGTKTRSYFASGRETYDLAAEAGPRLEQFDTSVQPAQLDDFPFGEDVPANREYDLQALMIRVSGESSDTGAALTGFRLTSDEVDFLARDSALVSPALASYPNAAGTIWPMLFPEEPTFSPGADLDVTVNVDGAGDGTVIIDMAMLFYRRAV